MTSLARVLDAVLERTVVPSFSRLGPAARSRLFDWQDAPANILHDRVAVVTGATSGIGATLAVRLAALGATVHLVGRSADKLAHQAAAVRSATGREACTHLADLTALDDVRSLAEDLLGSVDRVDILANVAGALVHERQITTDGIELTAQVHVVAPFLLTHQLVPLLTASGSARVITMSSGGMYSQRLNVAALMHPPDPFRGSAVYAQAKRAQVELGAQWARRYPSVGIGFHTMHPGWVQTPGLQEALPGFARWMKAGLRTGSQGADTAEWLAWCPEATAPGGHFWHDRMIRATTMMPGTSTPVGEAERLWTAVSVLAGISPP